MFGNPLAAVHSNQFLREVSYIFTDPVIANITWGLTHTVREILGRAKRSPDHVGWSTILYALSFGAS